MKGKEERDRRDQLVIAVLKEATEPIGPTEIARRIGKAEDWCYLGGFPQSSAIMPVMRRIGAHKAHEGRYYFPLPGVLRQEKR